MKTRLSLIASISMIALLSGCMGTQNEPVVLPQEQVLQVPVDVTPQNWELSGSNYTIIPISGDMTPTYSGDSFTTVKIIDNTTQKWAYFTTYSGTWTGFETAREYNMFPTEPASPIAISSLPSQAFATLSGMNNIIWHHIQVPIDHTLLVYEDNSMVYVLDFDDASGEMNMMSYNDIQILIQDLDITS